jgi:HEAT repeat protein
VDDRGSADVAAAEDAPGSVPPLAAPRRAADAHKRTSADPLVEAIDDPNGMVRFQAMIALRDHLHPGLLPLIERLLKDGDDDIRQYAVEYYAALVGGDLLCVCEWRFPRA